MIKDVPGYTGAGVYALVDENGKKYIGSAKNVKSRIQKHNKELQKALDGETSQASKSMIDAAKAGHIFRAVLVEKLPESGSLYDLRDMERRYLNEAGGLKSTYNTEEVPNQREEHRKVLNWWKTSETRSKKKEKIIKDIEKRIEEYTKPIAEEKKKEQFMIRTSVEEGAKIRQAAADAGMSVQGYILCVLREHIK